MALNRKARAQSRNDVTFEGESERGRSKGTATDYDRDVSRSVSKARADGHGHRPGLLHGAEVPDGGNDLDVGSWELGGVGVQERRPERIGVLATAQGDVTTDLLQMLEGTVRQPVGVDLCLVVPPAPQPDGLAVAALRRRHRLEPGLDIPLEDFGVEIGERRLGGEVDEGILGREEGLPTPPGSFRERIAARRPALSAYGKTTGSKQYRDRNVPGRVCSASSTRGTSARVSEGEWSAQCQVVDDGQHIGPEPGPGEVAVGRPVRAAVGPEVERPTVKTVTVGVWAKGRSTSAQNPVAWTSRRSSP